MNRSERRRCAKHGTPIGAKPTLTNEEFVKYVYLALADALHCEYGMTGDEVAKVFNKMHITIECLKTGYINLYDLKTMCEEELGISFVDKL